MPTSDHGLRRITILTDASCGPEIRVLFREFTGDETRDEDGARRWLLVRVMQRGELERATAGL